MFLDYKTVSFSNVDSGDDDIVYTTEWTHSLIMLEWQDEDVSGTEYVRVYANDTFNSNNAEFLLGELAGTSAAAGITDNLGRTYPVVVPSGVQIRAAATGENDFAGVLHVFRLPSAQ